MCSRQQGDTVFYMVQRSQVVAAVLLGLAWMASVFSVLVAYGVAEMYASSDSPSRSGISTALEVGGLPLMLVVLLCLGAVVAASNHRLLLWLVVATVPVSFLAVVIAGASAAVV